MEVPISASTASQSATRPKEAGNTNRPYAGGQLLWVEMKRPEAGELAYEAAITLKA